MPPAPDRPRSTRRIRPSLLAEVLEPRQLPASLVASPLAVSQDSTDDTVSAEAVSASATPVASTSDLIVTEKGKVTKAAILVTLSSTATKKTQINYKTQGVTALGTGKLRDFVASKGMLTIAKGSNVGRIRVSIVGDKRSEPDEVFNVLLTKATNATIATTAAGSNAYSRVVIRDDDTPALIRPTLTISSPTVAEGSAAVFVATLSTATARDVSVRYTTLDGTATSSSYTATSGILTIPAGSTSATIAVPTTATTTADGSRQFTAQFTAPANADLAATSATATITDSTSSSTTPALTIAAGTATVGTTVTSVVGFVVSLTAASTGAVTVDFSTLDGSAFAGTDYVKATGTLTFAAGETSKAVYVVVNGEATTSPSKTFSLVLSNASNALITNDRGIAVISYTTATAPTLSVASAAATVGTTGTGTLSFTVSLSASSTSTVSVNYATANGTAIAGTDYVASSGSLSFAPGETSKVVTVTVNGETTTGTTKNLTLNLTGATNTSNATASALGTITYSVPGSSATLATNLTNTTGGTEAATGTTYLAQRFSTGSSSYSLTAVNLLLAQATAGTAKVAIYSDAGLQPGSVVGTLTSPTSISSTATSTAFTSSGITLGANTNYWIVLIATGGAYNWSWTTTSTGTGSGFSNVWAQSTDSASSWFAQNYYPLQYSVTATVLS